MCIMFTFLPIALPCFFALYLFETVLGIEGKKNERTCVITCVNKLLVQALESCPFSEVTPCTCCSANLSTFYRENSKSAGLVNAYMDS